MGGSAGGGSTSIDPRDPNAEKKTIGKWYPFQENQFFDLINKYPVLQQANQGAQEFFANLPNLTGPLQSLFQNLPSIQPTINSLQQQFGGLPAQLQNQFGNLPQQLQNQFGALPNRLMELTPTLQRTARGYLSGIIGSQGALSPEASREAAQYSRNVGQSQYGFGAAPQLGGFANEILNRQSAREARYNTALGQYNAATGQIGALDQLAQGLGTQLATTRQGLGTNLAQVRQGLGTGLAGAEQALRSSDIAQRTGLAGAIQNLQSGGLNQLLGTAQGSQGVFSGLTNPILGYLGNLFSNNMQGRIAQAQINQQGNIAGDNKMAGSVGGVISAIGPILGAVMMSDERVKQGIKKTNLSTPEGVPLKTFTYKTNPKKRFLGVVAQDLEKIIPNTVITDPTSGVKFVPERFMPIEIGVSK